MQKIISKKSFFWLGYGIGTRLNPARSFPIKYLVKARPAINYLIRPYSTIEERPSDSSLLNSLLNEGEQAVKESDYNKSQSIYAKALDIAYRECGQQSAEAAVCLNWLGQVAQLQGKFKDATKYYEDAIAIISTNKTDEKMLLLATLYSNLGIIYQLLQDYENCIKNLDQALSILKKHAPDDIESIANIHLTLGKNYLYRDQLENSRENLLKALESLVQKYDEEDPQMGTLYLEIGFLFEKEGDPEEALKYKEKGVHLCEKKYGQDSFMMCPIYANLGDLYEALHLYPEALEYYFKAYNLAIKKYQSEPNIQTAMVLSYIGNAYCHLENNEKSLEYFQKSLKMFEELNIHDEAIIGTLYNNLGTVCSKTGETEEAIEYFKKAIIVRINVFGAEHIEVAYAYKNLGAAYASLERFEDAKISIRKTLNIFSLYPHTFQERRDLEDILTISIDS